MKDQLKKFFIGLLILIPITLPLKAENTGDVLAVSQCVYDLYIQLDDQQLREIIIPLGISKGGYKRVSTQELKVLLQKMPPITKQHAGGAAANTLAGITRLGGKTTFIGILGDDEFAQSYLKDMKLENIQMDTTIQGSVDGKGTALVILLITPDGERTIISYLGVSLPISNTIINRMTLHNHQILFSDAYAWDKEGTAKMLKSLYAEAREKRLLTAFGLGNASVVRIYREELQKFIPQVDFLFGNLSEYQALFDVESIETVIQKLQQIKMTAILTNADQGALIITPHAVLHAPAKRVKQIIDTTGAGDLFAAGFLYGLTKGWEIEDCGKLGSEMAGQVITQVGARLKDLSPSLQSLLKNAEKDLSALQ